MRIVFVADYFFEDRPGGSERSMEALIRTAPCEVSKVLSVNFRLSDYGPDDFVIFGNFSFLKMALIPEIVKRLNYAVIESDFKYCTERGPDLHKLVKGEECDCHKRDYGRRIFKFYEHAKVVFWKSTIHMQMHLDKYPALAKKANIVLAPTYTSDEIDYLLTLAKSPWQWGWAVFKADGWNKGYKEAADYCKRNHLWRVDMKSGNWVHTMNKLARRKGLVFLPNAMESASRIAIEARILGLEVRVNSKVPIASEDWFNKSREEVAEYVRGRTQVFWDEINKVL